MAFVTGLGNNLFAFNFLSVHGQLSVHECRYIAHTLFEAMCCSIFNVNDSVNEVRNKL